MKKLFAMGIICCIIFICHVSAFAEPYKGKAFPSDKLLRNLFEDIITDDVKFEKTVGTKKDSEGNYILYYQLKDVKNNFLHNETMMIVQLDNKVWIAYPYSDEEMTDTYVIIENVK